MSPKDDIVVHAGDTLVIQIKTIGDVKDIIAALNKQESRDGKIVNIDGPSVAIPDTSKSVKLRVPQEWTDFFESICVWTPIAAKQRSRVCQHAIGAHQAII